MIRQRLSITEWLALIAFVGGIVVWGVRMEGRQDAHHQSLVRTQQDVEYIRDRIDRVLEARAR